MRTKEKEQLYEETIKMKVLNNQIKEENVKLKTKVKILENELGRKERRPLRIFLVKIKLTCLRIVTQTKI